MGSVGGEEPEATAHPVGSPGPVQFEEDTPAGVGGSGLGLGTAAPSGICVELHPPEFYAKDTAIPATFPVN